MQADSFLACAGTLENLQSGAEMKENVKEGMKRQFSAWCMINIIFGVK